MNRFSKLPLKHLNLNNRVVVPPMASSTASELGFVTDKTLNHYARLAHSGAGLLFVEYTYVDMSGKSESNQLGADHDDKIDGLTRLAQIFKTQGLVSGLQLTHSGAKSSRELTGGVLWGPSSIRVPAYKSTLEIPDELPKEMITSYKKDFVEAAQRAQMAGFDIVELHCAHGYGINQWLSPLTNQRSDEYGGSPENRARILFEIIEEIRIQLPEIILATRLPGQDLLDGGMSLSDTIWIAKELEKRGVDLLDISSGLGGWRRPKERRGQGYLIPEAKAVQSSIGLPIIGVGGISEGEYIDDLISKNSVSLAAVGRAILEDPCLWYKNVMTK